jgi:4'-phosphopantetheinyl transferase
MRDALRWKPAPAFPGLAPGEVQVFSVSLDDLPLATPVSRLSDDESRRAGSFYFERDRRRFAATRGVLRGLLGRYLAVDPSALVFGYGPQGKPALAAPWQGLRFNVSHSGGLALLAFSADHEIGVDIEQERPVPEMDSIAERNFSPRESAALRVLGDGERGRAFFRCWTRKEAFIKAVGDGLSHPLDAFDVTLAPGEPARLLRVAGDHEAPKRFLLQGLEPADGFAAALAVLGRPTRVACYCWDQSLEEMNGPRRERRQDDLQGGREPRRAVLDLAD